MQETLPASNASTRKLVLRLLIATLWILALSSAASAQTDTLTVNTLGSGSVSADPPGPYNAGDVVTLTASPDAGWSFSSWSGNLTGYANPGTLIMNDNYTVTATFDQVAYAGVTGDPRTLTEPTFPPVCTTLLAQQSSGSMDQTLFDTTRLQAALDSCPAGQAVELSASGSNDAFLIQPIVLDAGVTLLIDAEVTLFGSNNQADYNCGSDCTPLIQVAANSGTPGSAIMGYGIIDGQGSVWWGSDPRPRLIYVGNPSTHARSDNFTLYKITLQNSPQINLYSLSNGMTVWGAKVRNPGNSPNTDGIDPSGSSNFTIRDSYISTGDDHIALKAGNIGHIANVTITHNHLYYGHGLSMGSETNGGIENFLATDNVIDQNGCAGCSSSDDIRIKSDSSRGGEVKNVLYQDTCIRNGGTQPHEFVFDPYYSSQTGDLIPNFHDIYMKNVHMVDAGNSSKFIGHDADHVLTVFMDNVVWNAFNSHDFTSQYTSEAAFTLGPGPVNFASTLIQRAMGDVNVTVTNNISGSDAPYDCTGRFVYLAGELFTLTPSVPAGSPVTLTSVLQPAIFSGAAPTGTIDLLEGSAVVASGSIAGRVAYITVPSVSTGTHTYVASYPGDGNYSQLYYGSVTVTAF